MVATFQQTVLRTFSLQSTSHTYMEYRRRVNYRVFLRFGVFACRASPANRSLRLRGGLMAYLDDYFVCPFSCRMSSINRPRPQRPPYVAYLRRIQKYRCARMCQQYNYKACTHTASTIYVILCLNPHTPSTNPSDLCLAPRTSPLPGSLRRSHLTTHFSFTEPFFLFIFTPVCRPHRTF